MQKLRTIKDCVEEIKKQDPKTAITEYFIRQLCQSGRVASLFAGDKF